MLGDYQESQGVWVGVSKKKWKEQKTEELVKGQIFRTL